MEDINSNSSKGNEESSSEENNSIKLYYQPQPTLNLNIKNLINYWKIYSVIHFINIK